jgi:hypothetical protein
MNFRWIGIFKHLKISQFSSKGRGRRPLGKSDEDSIAKLGNAKFLKIGKCHFEIRIKWPDII